MEKQELITYLLRQIAQADAAGEDTVRIRKQAAAEIVRLLSGQAEALQPPMNRDGDILFFCADCGQSFWAKPREDRDCFDKWHYHTWYAKCPLCGREVSRNDRYWR